MKETNIVNPNKPDLADIILSIGNSFISANDKLEFAKNIYFLYIFYSRLIKLLETFFKQKLFLQEVNENYLRLCVRIDDILKLKGFEELKKMKWKPFLNLTPMVPHLDIIFQDELWILHKDNCMNFMNLVTEIHVKNGFIKYDYALSDKDRSLLNDCDSFIVQYIQNGYKEIFKGSIQAIRNPKAHENIKISENEAIHLIFLASLLMFKLDNTK